MHQAAFDETSARLEPEVIGSYGNEKLQESFRELFRAPVGVDLALVAELSAISAPSMVSAEHAKLIEWFSTGAERAEQQAAELEMPDFSDMSTSGDVIFVTAEYDPTLFDACSTIQNLAIERDVAVDLECEQFSAVWQPSGEIAE